MGHKNTDETQRDRRDKKGQMKIETCKFTSEL